MLLMFDDRMKPILAKHLGMGEDVLLEMKYAYADAMQKLQITESLDFIEEKRLTDEGAYVDSLSDTTLPKEKQLENLEMLYVYFIELAQRFPELGNRIEDKIRTLHRGITSDLLDALPEEALAEISTFFVADMNAILEMKDRFPEFELPERLKKFRPAS
ncbi:MAG: hypothetical protein TR69_WS6001000502 [candidate division WS6 bacterium OLB20]|uniref:Uncharacterized protein n=1 Tax=candidate division WS6 bacterium OLB20 TaxID=1617426 RepID=A0A136LXV9_9BACT|nr:MAG: hypothetical protein TR69_WS6001000502 [candidate division WS6 bacterium OLB20]